MLNQTMMLYCVLVITGCRLCAGIFCFQAEDGIRDLVRSRGLGDVYKRQDQERGEAVTDGVRFAVGHRDVQRMSQPQHSTRIDLSLIHI